MTVVGAGKANHHGHRQEFQGRGQTDLYRHRVQGTGTGSGPRWRFRFRTFRLSRKMPPRRLIFPISSAGTGLFYRASSSHERPLRGYRNGRQREEHPHRDRGRHGRRQPSTVTAKAQGSACSDQVLYRHRAPACERRVSAADRKNGRTNHCSLSIKEGLPRQSILSTEVFTGEPLRTPYRSSRAPPLPWLTRE